MMRNTMHKDINGGGSLDKQRAHSTQVKFGFMKVNQCEYKSD